MVIQLTNHTLQLYNRLGARFSMNTRGVDYVYMLEQITLLKSEIGDEELKQYLNAKYPSYKVRISNFWNLVRDIKFFFDKLEKKDKAIEIKEDDSKLFNKYLSINRQIKFSDCCLVADAFIFLVKMCSIKDQRIPNEYFKSEERMYLKFTSWANKPRTSEHLDFGGD